MFCSWKEVIPSSSTNWGLMGWSRICWKGPDGLGQAVEPAVCPGREGGQQPPGLLQKECSQQPKKCGYFTLVTRSHLEFCDHLWSLSCRTWEEPSRGHWDYWGVVALDTWKKAEGNRFTLPGEQKVQRRSNHTTRIPIKLVIEETATV